MKPLPSILLAAAAVAVAAPAAGAARATSVPQHTQAKKHRVATKHTSRPRVVPAIIIVAPPVQGAAPSTSVDNCLAFMVDCTPQESCANWGIDCDLAAAAAGAADPATRDETTP